MEVRIPRFAYTAVFLFKAPFSDPDHAGFDLMSSCGAWRGAVPADCKHSLLVRAPNMIGLVPQIPRSENGINKNAFAYYFTP